jgi:hypothetical protein
VEEIDRIVQTQLVAHGAAPLDDLVRAMVEAMVQAHARDPELHELLSTEVPHGAEGTQDFTVRLHGAFRLALSSRAHEIGRRRKLDKIVFVVAHMVDALSHGAVLRRPPGLSLAAAKQEAVRAVWAYLHG